MFTADAVLAQARSEIGYTESPPGSNRNKFAAEVGHANGQAWCASYACAMARRCGGKFGNESAYTPSLYDSMAHAGSPRAGDLVFFDFPDDVYRIQHVGIVESVTASTVTSIDGNTAVSGSQSNGGAVLRRTRPRGYVVGYGRPNYNNGEDDLTDAERDALFAAVGRIDAAVKTMKDDLAITKAAAVAADTRRAWRAVPAGQFASYTYGGGWHYVYIDHTGRLWDTLWTGKDWEAQWNAPGCVVNGGVTVKISDDWVIEVTGQREGGGLIRMVYAPNNKGQWAWRQPEAIMGVPQ